MPIELNNFVNIITTNLNVSDFNQYLKPQDQALIATLAKENIVLLLDLINEIQLIEKNGAVSLLDVLTIVLIVDKAVKELVRAKKAVSVNHLNVERFLLETLEFNLLKFPDGIPNNDIKRVLENALEILSTSPKIKIACSKFFFWFANISNHDEILHHICPVYFRYG